MWLTDEVMCRYCQSEEETVEYTLCQCDRLANVRFFIQDNNKPFAIEIIEVTGEYNLEIRRRQQ